MGIRVVLADDHLIVRQGLVSLLERESDIQVTGQANNGLELINLVRHTHPDVVVTDISMPGLNGFEAIHRILAYASKPKVVCLSIHDDQNLVRALIHEGVSAYLVKGCAYKQLIHAVRIAMEGLCYLSPEVTGSVAQDCRSPSVASEESAYKLLTSREREIVQLFAEGHNTRQIAARLHISEKTVASHREHIMDKLQITGIAELTHYAIREGLCAVLTPCPSLNLKNDTKSPYHFACDVEGATPN